MNGDTIAKRIFYHFKHCFDSYARHFESRVYMLDRGLERFISVFPEFDYELFLSSTWTPLDYAHDMHFIIQRSNDEECLEFLNTYFTLNFLKIFADWVKELSSVARSDIIHVATYPQMMKLLRSQYPRLITAYLEALVKKLTYGEYIRFAVTNVGSLVDQDDIDIGVICFTEKDAELTNRVMARIQKQMQRSGLPIHCYLSETIGKGGFAVTFAEYDDFLYRQRSDIVVISQLLGAVFLTGDFRVYTKFEEEVLERYHFGDTRTNYFHESYLFGVIDEMERLIDTEFIPEKINPKYDAYRLIKMITASVKTIFRIRNKNLWQIVHELKMLDTPHLSIYNRLEDALSFFEICRVVFQVAISQDDNVIPTQVRRNVAKLARIIGYLGANRVERFFSVYAEQLRELKKTATLIKNSIIWSHIRGSEVGYADIMMGHTRHTTAFASPALIDTESKSMAHLLERFFIENDEKTIRPIMAHVHELHRISSRYFKYYLDKLALKYPEHIKHLTDNEWFLQLSEHCIESINYAVPFTKNLERLADYYCIELVRHSLGYMGLNPVENLHDSFIAMLRTMLINVLQLFDQQIGSQIQPTASSPTTTVGNLLACYLTGGYARGEIYNEDIDLLIIIPPKLDRNTRGMLQSIMNHLNRFTNHIGSRIHYEFDPTNIFPTINSLRTTVKQATFNSLRQHSRLLHAHFLMGNAELHSLFQHRIVEPLLKNPKSYVINILLDRNKRLNQTDPKLANIKEESGGLVDIHTLASALNVTLKLNEPNTLQVLKKAQHLFPAGESEFGQLIDAYTALQKLRDMYRLTVAADNVLHFNYMIKIAEGCGFNLYQSIVDVPEHLETHYRKTIDTSKRCTKELFSLLCAYLKIKTNLL